MGDMFTAKIDRSLKTYPIDRKALQQTLRGAFLLRFTNKQRKIPDLHTSELFKPPTFAIYPSPQLDDHSSSV